MGALWDYGKYAVNPFWAASEDASKRYGGPSVSDLDPAKGYNTAAAGANRAGAMAEQFSGTQWDRQMQGLGQAQGAYNPSQAYWNSTYGAQGPGAFQNWYQQNQSQFNQPTASGGANDSYQNWMKSNPYSQSATSYGQAVGEMGPHNAQNYWNMTAQPGMSGPGAGEQFWAQNQQRYQPQSQQGVAYSVSNMQQPSRSETHQVDTSKAGQAVNMLGDIAVQAQASGRTLHEAAPEVQNYFRGADDVSRYANSQMGQLAGPGIYEQWAASTLNDTNPYIQRQHDQAQKALNQQMAKRGHFSSGGAMEAMGNLLAAQGAEAYREKGNLAQGAQAMGLQRIGQGTQTTQASGAQKLAQGQSLQNLASERVKADQAGMGLSIQASQGQGSLANDIERLKLGAAGQADQSQMARLMGAGQLSGQMDATNLGYLNAAQNAAQSSQAQQLARLMGGYQMNQGLDANQLARAQQLFGMGQGVDQANMARFGMGGQLGNAADQQALARLLGSGQMAGQSQQFGDDRTRDAMAMLFGLNNAQAGLYGNFYGQGGQYSGQAMSDAYNAYANAAALQGQGQTARARMPWDAMNVYSSYQGGAGGRR